MSDNNTTIGMKKDLKDKAEQIRQKRGLRSLSQVVNTLIEEEYKHLTEGK